MDRSPRRDVIDQSILDRLLLAEIDSVTFYKRDELTTDLICCDVGVDGRVWVFHEEADGWDLLLLHLERLPGFRMDWYQSVALPPFAPCETVAYRRR